MLKVWPTSLSEVLVVETRVFADPRGSFHESYHRDKYAEAGIACTFMQDNVSYSSKGVIRGLHLQHPSGQDKLIYVLKGEIFDVAVDVRRGSPTFGKWSAEILSAENHRQLFVPRGFAHGFCALSDDCIVTYKCSDLYNPSTEASIIWNDPDIGIEWPVMAPLLSDKDKAAPRLAGIAEGVLPSFEALRS